MYRKDDKPLSSELAHLMSGKRLLEIEAYDIQLLGALASGLTQDEIAQTFKKDAIIPNGTSSIEKRINKLKIYFKANNNVHLIALAKDLGLI